MSYLELGALIQHLPAESALRTAQRNQYTDEQLAEMAEKALADGVPHGRWSHSDSLTAMLIDSVQALIHVQLARGGVKADTPKPLRRPGVVDEVRKVMNPQALAYFDRIRELHQQQREGAS